MTARTSQLHILHISVITFGTRSGVVLRRADVQRVPDRLTFLCIGHSVRFRLRQRGRRRPGSLLSPLPKVHPKPVFAPVQQAAKQLHMLLCSCAMLQSSRARIRSPPSPHTHTTHPIPPHPSQSDLHPPYVPLTVGRIALDLRRSRSEWPKVD